MEIALLVVTNLEHNRLKIMVGKLCRNIYCLQKKVADLPPSSYVNHGSNYSLSNMYPSPYAAVIVYPDPAIFVLSREMVVFNE